ncbi:MAG TPA: response regulator [Blastocatellia bacterium]|nr:response regulator [Blastocatellia bacterium]
MGARQEARANGNRRTLLIIDDDEEWTEVAKLFFRDKYDVEVANSACDAMEMVSRGRPSAIIVDLVMPTVDGFGVIHRLNDSGNSRIPTILVTGWKTAEVEECAVAVGCAAVLAKPVDLTALDAIVASVISSAAASPAAVM